MVVSKEQLLDFCRDKFFGQKICVLGAASAQQDFLANLSKSVAFVPIEQADKTNCVAVLCFGEVLLEKELTKKAIMVATDARLALRKNFLLCYDFFEFDNEQASIVASIVVEATIFGQKLFCKQILEGKEVVDDARCYFAAMLDCLQSVKKGEAKKVCTMLDKLKDILDCGECFDFVSIVSKFLYTELCYHFLKYQPFDFVYDEQRIGDKYGLPHIGTSLNATDAIFRLKEFYKDLFFVLEFSKNCIEASLLLYKKSNIEEISWQINNVDNQEIIKKVFLVEQKNELGLIGIMQLLGLV